QAIQVIRAALPAFTAPAQPRTIRSDVRPELVEVPTKSGSLNLKLLAKPARRLHGTERQEAIGALLQRRTIRNRMHVGGKHNGRKHKHGDETHNELQVKIYLYFIGKPRDANANGFADEFIKRTSRYVSCEMREIQPAR